MFDADLSDFAALEAYQELEDFRQDTVIKHGNGQFRIAPFADDFPIEMPISGDFFQPLIFLGQSSGPFAWTNMATCSTHGKMAVCSGRITVTRSDPQ